MSPKSSSTTRPSSSTRMLDGLMSRCSFPYPCRACTARQSWPRVERSRSMPASSRVRGAGVDGGEPADGRDAEGGVDTNSSTANVSSIVGMPWADPALTAAFRESSSTANVSSRAGTLWETTSWISASLTANVSSRVGMSVEASPGVGSTTGCGR